MRRGVLGEFLTPGAMLDAIVELRRRGHRGIDAFMPYPVKGTEEALGLERSPITWYLLPFAILGAAGAYLLQWWMNAHDYPLNVGGRPLHSAPSFIPITFEMGVLFTAVFGLLVFCALSRLPELWSPVFDVPGFERASIDRFWVGVDAADPSFDRAQAERDLEELGAARVAFAGEEEE
jgi:hypothetical protein